MGDLSVSLSNRRFTAIVLSGNVPTNVVYRDPTKNELKRLNQLSVLGDKLPSRRIAITGSRNDTTPIGKPVSLDDIGNDAAVAAEQQSVAVDELAESEAIAQARAQAIAASEEAEIEAEADAADF